MRIEFDPDEDIANQSKHNRISGDSPRFPGKTEFMERRIQVGTGGRAAFPHPDHARRATRWLSQ